MIEGICYDVNWKHFKRGTSILIPCLDTKAAKEQVLKVTKRLKVNVVTKAVVVEGIRGLRMWRV